MTYTDVLKVVGTGYLVKSRTTPGAWWLVRFPGGECSCPATTKSCWHVKRLQEMAAEEREREKRPTAPANVSALVD